MILCLGPSPTVQRSMSFDRLAVDAVNRTGRVREYASGKATNAARVLHALGAKTVAMGVAAGRRGAVMRADLDASGVPHEFIDVPGDTRLSTTVIDRTARTATELVEEPADLTHEQGDAMIAALHRRVADEAAPVRGVVLSGALPGGLGDDFYARCVRATASAPGDRPVPTVLDVRGPALLAACAERPWVVKPNRGELAETLGRDINSQSSLVTAMRELAARGPAWVVVTQGDGPTLAAPAEGPVWQVFGPRVPAVSPIGSGDAFAAGLALALRHALASAPPDRRRPDDPDLVPNALRLAAACGAANALTEFAGHVTAADVDRLVREVRVGRLD